jgi:outer membrane protein OmpA-like peptidoglycan-associated protein
MSTTTKLLAAILLCISLNVLADGTEPPAADLPGLIDPAGLKRIEGAVLVGGDQVAYDELALPAGPLKRDEAGNDHPSASLPVAAGVRSRLIYILPAGRSTLEAIRSYQTEMAPAGFKVAWECADDACGASTIFGYNMINQLWPSSAWTFEDASPASCTVGNNIGESRYTALSNASTGAVLGVVAWRPDINSVYCADGAFQKRTGVAVTYISPKAREQSMVSISASEMEKSIAQTGRVALYGIFFDTASATLKPESKPALDEIAKLLKSQPTMKLHVVGHTDNQGGLESNFDLSKRRAASVRQALIGQYAIDGARLTSNGVSYLAPVASNADEAGRAKNRRVELVPM